MRVQAILTKKRLLGVLLLLSVVTPFLGAGPTASLRRTAAFFLSPLADSPMYAVTYLKSRLAPPEGTLTAAEAERLREEARYFHRLAIRWEYEREVYRRRAEALANFQALYGPVRDLACELVPARVVAAGSLPYDHTRVVNPSGHREAPRGACVLARQLLTQRSKALPPRLAVVTAGAMVGRITEAGAFTARLKLLTDRSFRLRARIRRRIDPRRPRKITVTDDGTARETLLSPDSNPPIDVWAQGDGANGLLVEDVREYDNVLPGDLLVTSAKAENLPAEIHVGKVVEVVSDPEDPHRRTVRVRPHADLPGLREVYILVPLGMSSGQP